MHTSISQRDLRIARSSSRPGNVLSGRYPYNSAVKPSTTAIATQSQLTSLVACERPRGSSSPPHACCRLQEQFVCRVCEHARWAFHGCLSRATPSRRVCTPRAWGPSTVTCVAIRPHTTRAKGGLWQEIRPPRPYHAFLEQRAAWEMPQGPALHDPPFMTDVKHQPQHSPCCLQTTS